MKKVDWVLKTGWMAAGIAVLYFPLTSAAEEAKPSIIVLAKTSQPALERAIIDVPDTVIEVEPSQPTVAVPDLGLPVWVPRTPRGSPASRIG